MAAEDIGPIYTTKIPGLADNADIQDALKLFHYGTKTAPTSRSAVLANSVAGHIKAAEDRITTLEGIGIGSSYSATEPVSVPNGFVWVKSDSAAISIANTQTSAVFSTTEPTGTLTAGMLWVDSDASPLLLKVYDGNSWEAVSSSGGTPFTPPTSSQLTLSGSDVASLSAGTPFGYLNGSTPAYFYTTVLVTTYSKNEVSVSLGKGSSIGGATGGIALVRIINGNIPGATPIALYEFNNNSPLAFTFVDDHSETAGTAVSYGLLNMTTGDVSFSGSYSVQISAREIA